MNHSSSMATFPKIADNEMNYFQYRAKQMLLLKKENREWQDFCKQTAPGCAACVAEQSATENRDLKESKEIGIQAFPRRSFIRTERPSSVHLRSQDLSEALTSIKTRLEKIDLALSKFPDVSQESEKPRTPAILPRNSTLIATAGNTEALKQFEDQRKMLIQNSLKMSLQKLRDSKSVISKQTFVKPKQSGYFLPHDLQLKRAAARKAYLASLQTKPKIIPRNVKKSGTKDIQTTFKGKNTPKKMPKSRKNSTAKNVTKESDFNKEETLIKATAPEFEHDPVIENIVDGILEDLLGDTVLDFNKIKQIKKESKGYKKNNKKEETFSPLGSLNSSPKKGTESKVLTNDGCKSITKLKQFLDSSENSTEMDHPRKVQSQDKSTSTSKTADLQGAHHETCVKKSCVRAPLSQNNYEVKVPRKFVCGVSHILTIGPDEAKRISQNRDRFWQYLERTSQTAKGNFNPWILNETLAESILDDCLNDIAEELCELPSTSVQELYNEEFLQQVEN